MQPLLLHQPVHFLVYPHDWIPNKIILFYLSVQSISPILPRPKDDRCAAVPLHVYTIKNLHKLHSCLYWCVVYMDACPGKRLLTILKFETTAHPTETSIPEASLTPLARDRAIKACDSERCNWLVESSLDQCHRILHCEMFCKMRVYCSRSG